MCCMIHFSREGSDGRDSCADTSDSGLGSTDISMASFRSKGAIPKKTAHYNTNARITRSRASTSTSSSGMDSDFASPIPPPLTIGKAGGRSSKKKLQVRLLARFYSVCFFFCIIDLLVGRINRYKQEARPWTALLI